MINDKFMMIFATEVNHLKLLFPFLKYTDTLKLLCSSKVFYDLLIHETRQIKLSFKGSKKLLQDSSFILNKIADPSKQLSIYWDDHQLYNVENEGKKAFPRKQFQQIEFTLGKAFCVKNHFFNNF